MLTPIEIQGKTFKSGFGYDKKDVDSFFRDILGNYEILYKESVELTDKLSVLSEAIQYYKTIEKTLQNALILAEKTSDETTEAAKIKAAAIIKEAHSNANVIVADSKYELEKIHQQTIQLVQQYDKYKIQFKKLAETQIEIINSTGFNISIANLEAFSDSKLPSKTLVPETEDRKEKRPTPEERAAIKKNKIEEAAISMEEFFDLPEEEEGLSIEDIIPKVEPVKKEVQPVLSRKIEPSAKNQPELARTFEDLTVNLDDEDFDFISYEN